MIQQQSPVLTVHNALVSYGTVPALDGLCLELKPGEILGLLGPNGAGKTTLINCLSGRMSLAGGMIKYALPGRLNDIVGIVPQEIAIYPDLTVKQNLVAFGRLHGLASKVLQTRVDEALSWANLKDRASSPVKTLSGGMQRRLNMACSVLHRPPVLLLDEPTVGVDPQSRERIYTMLGSLTDQGTAILLTTHHLEEAESRCNRIAIIDAGRVLAVGTFEELLQQTIGTSQQICVRFRSRPEQVPLPLKLADSGLEAVGVLDDASLELPRLLHALRSRNAAIEHLTLREPTLQHLFLYLTGKELRE